MYSGVGLCRHVPLLHCTPLLRVGSPSTALQTEVCSELWWGVVVQLDQQGKGLQDCCAALGLVRGPLGDPC